MDFNILLNLHTSNTHLRQSPPSLSHLLHCRQIPDLCCLKHHRLGVLPDLIDPNTLVVWVPKTEVENTQDEKAGGDDRD